MVLFPPLFGYRGECARTSGLLLLYKSQFRGLYLLPSMVLEGALMLRLLGIGFENFRFSLASFTASLVMMLY